MERSSDSTREARAGHARHESPISLTCSAAIAAIAANVQ